MSKIIEKIRNLCEILLLPGGIGLKWRYSNFHWRDYRMCLRLKSSGVKPRTIIDAGANEGQFAIGATRAFPDAKIHCFEPGTAAFERLKSNLGGQANITFHKKALGAENGVAQLHLTNNDQSSSLLCLHNNHKSAYPAIKEIGIENVQIIKLDAEFDKIANAKPVLLKIDTQGFELEVLKGTESSLDSIDWIILETATKPMYEGEAEFDKIYKWLEKKNFALAAPFEIHFSTHGNPCQFDALFSRNSQ
jgi:FkbM family methyltransferase